MRHLAVTALLLAVALPAHAAPPPPPATTPAADRAALLRSWTQPTAASSAAWNTARLERSRWSSYGFDWTTDLCSRVPETPLGFDFTDACRRHDFGYRNYRTALADHKARLDEAFRADLRHTCDSHRLAAQPFCNAIAFTYFEAVRLLPKT
ncbi:phospholipase [Actinoplanes utahensis]|uniref:Phospholipase A2 n=1 Tax=Actinoplanes utahensis TaxID=1869 RepID=A0A0A6UBY4_ACTUT|nr:phospholipase [Actinoplanes utahensis]KHD72593.1 hypothetical protein MB27_39855 [Actinoplanes utahensis]GIF29273.1 hypothetical protein Aut01nite_22590 [Actinoplanes utahensis]